jgi:hypothetical protein
LNKLRSKLAARAVANGVRLGRKPTLTHHQQQEAIKSLNAGKEMQGEIARSYNVSRWATSRLKGWRNDRITNPSSYSGRGSASDTP